MGAGSPKPIEPGIHRQQQGYIQDPSSYLAFLNSVLGGGATPQGPPPGGLQGILQALRPPQAPFRPDPGFLGVPQSDLQRSGANAIGSMLQGPTPEQRALDIALPQLQEMLTGTGPQFERDLSLANQQGGRFGSANAILRGEALRNLYNMRTQTAGTLGMLSGGAGGANRAQAQQAFDVGTLQAGQGDIALQRQLQILLQLLGAGQQTGFQYQQGGGLGSVLGGIGGMVLGGVLPGVGTALGNKLFPAPAAKT